MGIIWRTLINAIAIVVAAYVVNIYQPDAIKWGQVDYGMGDLGRYLSLALTGLTLGIVNAIVKPILIVLTFPFLIVTLGLFLLVLNGAMLWLTGAISDAADLGFHVSGFGAAFLGGLVVSVVSFLLSLMVGKDSKRNSKR